MNRIIITSLLIFIFLPMFSQGRLLDDPAMLEEIRTGIHCIYYGDFQSSENVIRKLENKYPFHPAVEFLMALQIYWKEFPLTPSNPASEKFTSLMLECVEKAEKMEEKNENDLEAVFFDLFGRAFYIMYWADNGKPGKVFPHMNQLYRNTLKGFEMKEKFNEYYFTTGLYNYYIVAYPEDHPSYKPVARLFSGGNKELGIKQLKYCAENAVFVRVEAKLFLSLIYLNYEQDLDKASEYAAELYREFPKNSYYTGKYLEILLYNQKYFFAPILIQRLEENPSDFSQMLSNLFRGMYLEKYNGDYQSAETEYLKALKLSEQYGDFSSYYNAIAWMGLGRCSKRNGDRHAANKYFKMAKSATNFEYILKDQ